MDTNDDKLETLKKWVKKSFNGILKEKIIAKIESLQSKQEPEEKCDWFPNTENNFFIKTQCGFLFEKWNNEFKIEKCICGKKINLYI